MSATDWLSRSTRGSALLRHTVCIVLAAILAGAVTFVLNKVGI